MHLLGGSAMELRDEAITYQYQALLVPGKEDWSAAAEMRAAHLLPPQTLKDLLPRLGQVRSQVAAEREIKTVPPELEPIEAGFIDLPQKLAHHYRRKTEKSGRGRGLGQAGPPKEQCDRGVGA